MKNLIILQKMDFHIAQKVVNTFSERTLGNLFIQTVGETYNYTSFDESKNHLSAIKKWHPWTPWFIYSKFIDSSMPSLSIEIPGVEGSSLEEIENLFQSITEKFQWSLFTWGATVPTIAFLCDDMNLSDRFLEIYT